jgi:hypothetical protein
MSPHWNTFWKAASGIVLLVLLIAVFALPGCLDAAFRLAFGWMRYGGDALSSMRLDAARVIVIAALLCVYVLGVHLVLGWLYYARRGYLAKTLQTSEVSRQERWRSKWTIAISSVTVLALMAGISFFGVALNVDRQFRQVHANPRRHLRDMHRATELHKEKLGLLPSGAIARPDGRLLHGWQTQLLPYLDHQAIYEKIDLQVPWNDPSNHASFSLEVAEFGGNGAAYGTRAQEGYAPTVFAANSQLLGGTEVVQPTKIIDGTHYTILAGEITGELPAWGEPASCRDPAAGLGDGREQFGSPWEGVHVLMADGSVRCLSRDIDPGVLRSMATPDGGEWPPY